MNYKLTSTKDLVIEMINHIHHHDIIAYDVESTGLNVRKSKIIGFAISGCIGEGYYFPIYQWDVESQELVDVLIDGVKAKLLASTVVGYLLGKKLIMHNGSYDIQITANDLLVDLLSDLYADTLLLVHTVREEGVFALKDIAVSIQEEIGFDVEQAANEEQIKLKENVKKNGGEVTKTNFELYKGDLEVIWPYAVKDVDLTLRVFYYYIDKLRKEGLEDFFFVEEVMPLLREVTIPMEMKGVRLDIPLIEKNQRDIIEDLENYKNKVIEELRVLPYFRQWVMDTALKNFPPSNKGSFAQEIVKYYNLPLPITDKGKYSITKSTLKELEDSPIKQYLIDGNPENLPARDGVIISVEMWKKKTGGLINIQSKQQLGEIAFNYMKIKPLSQTEKGSGQFDDDFIEHLISKGFNWAKNLSIYNKLLKIKSSYIDRFLEGQEDGRYYFYYKQHGTISGRYSSDAQQLPRPLEEGEQDAAVLKYRNEIRAFFIPDDGYSFIDSDYESLEPKCVYENSIIQTKEGFKYIKNINIGDYINTIGGWKVVLNKTTTKKEGVAVITSKGSLICSLDHKIYVEDREWVEASKLNKGNVLVNLSYNHSTEKFNNTLPVFFKDASDDAIPFATLKVDTELAWCMGAFLGDGIASRGRSSYVGICGLKPDGIVDRFCTYFNRFGLSPGVYEDKRTEQMYNVQYHDVWFKQVFNKSLRLVDTEVGKILRVPEFIFNADEDIKTAFFAGIIDTDGTYNDKKSEMSISSKSSDFCNDIIILGRSLGLDGRLGLAHKNVGDKRYYVYQVRFTAISINRLFDLHINDYLSCDRKKLKGHRMIGKFKMPKPVIKEIVPVGMLNMVDITVEGNEEFICGGFRVHNCFSHVAQDQGLIDIFLKGHDFYSTIAIKTEKMKDVSPDKKAENYLGKVNKPARQKAKAYSLGIPYGMKAYALGQSIGVSTKEAEELIEGYLSGFPNLRKWMDESERLAKENGFIKTQVGRVRHLTKFKEVYDTFGEDITDWNYRKGLIGEFEEEEVRGMFLDYINGLNNARNFQIQSLAASIVNRAAIAINRKFKEVGIDGLVVAQIHDQIIIHVKDDERLNEAAQIVQDLMENTTKLSLPLTAPPAIAKNFRDGH